MRAWLLLLAGPLIWAAHFLVVYFIASVAAHVQQTGDVWPRIAIAAATIVAMVALGGALALLRDRADQLAVFRRSIALGGIVLGLIAVAWQTLPALAL